MLSLSRTRLLIGLALLAGALLPGSTAKGQGNSKPITFDTADGVKLSGTLYPGGGGKKDAVVMLLHTFDLKKGGSSQQDGWSRLAKRMQDEGYTVLSFDFRGFGDSKSVNERFWTFKHNLALVKGGQGAKQSETIDHTKFNSLYLPYLINDIAAAKAYIDRRNDAGQMNAGNVILIGAGEGAALGALWLKNECRRRRDTNMPPVLLPLAAQLSQPEINDIACAVWLSINPGNIKRISAYTRSALYEAAVTHKVPMAFVYGEQDSKNKNLSQSYFQGVRTSKLTGSHGVSGTKLAGNLLLEKDTIDWILKNYLEKVLDARGGREQKDRKSEASAYWYTLPKGKTAWKISKNPGQEAPLVDVDNVVAPPQ